MPRVWTKPLRPLTRKTTLGYHVTQFAEDVLEIELYPWQKWLLLHALELLPDGSFRYRTVVLLVARQNGKSTLGQVLALYFLYVVQVRLVLGTAQTLDLASDLWRDTVEMARDVPELADEIEKVTAQTSRELLELTGRRQYKVAAATRRGGRGKTGDLVLLDELREHQTWAAWSAITKTTMARAMALVWCMSNAGDSTSVVLRHLRKQAHARLGDPDDLNKDSVNPLQELLDGLDDADMDAELAELMEQQADSLGIFEWSAKPGCGKWDRDGWAQANPSLGHGELSERNIASAAATDPEWEFRTEVLCQWYDGVLQGPFYDSETGADPWPEGVVNDQPPAGTPFKLGLDVEKGRNYSAISAAYYRPDGLPQVNLEEYRAGTGWVLDWFKEHATEERPLVVAVQERGAPATSLIDDLDALEHVTVARWGGVELGNGTARMFDLVKISGVDEAGVRTGLCHLQAPALDVAAAQAVPKILSDGGVAWDRVRSTVDISALVSATAALWALHQPDAVPTVSAYDQGAELTVLD